MKSKKRVVVGIIVRKDDTDKYLLVKSKRDYGKYTGFYYPPSGKVEEGEGEEEALKREIDEELSLEVTECEKIAETGADIENQATVWYKCNINSFDYSLNTDELGDAGYFSIKDMESMEIWPETRKFFKKYISAH